MDVRNRKINPHKKLRPESIDDLQDVISAQKEAIERGNEIIRNLKGNPGWDALCLNFKEELDELESNLDHFHTFEERIQSVMLKRRADLREFLGKIESVEKTVSILQEEMAQNLSDLSERKNRVRQTQNA